MKAKPIFVTAVAELSQADVEALTRLEHEYGITVNTIASYWLAQSAHDMLRDNHVLKNMVRFNRSLKKFRKMANAIHDLAGVQKDMDDRLCETAAGLDMEGREKLAMMLLRWVGQLLNSAAPRIAPRKPRIKLVMPASRLNYN